MPVDTSIYNALLQRPPSAIDYQNDYQKAALSRQQLQQNAFAMQQAAAVNAQKQALRDAVQSGQIDLTAEGGQSRALSLAPDVAPSLLKTVQDGLTARAKAGLDTAQAGRVTQETATGAFNLTQQKREKAIQDIVSFNSPDDALASLKMHVQNGDLDMTKAMSMANSIPKDPVAFKQWQLQTLRGLMTPNEAVNSSKPVLGKADTGGATVYTAQDPFTGAVTQTGSIRNTVGPNVVYAQGHEDARAAASRQQAAGTLTYQTDGNGNLVALPTHAGAPVVAQSVMGADGKPMVGKANLTETQGKAMTFAARMQDAEAAIDALEKDGVSGGDFRTIAAGSGWTNWLASPKGQQYRQAQENWVTANLRQESGAAIGKEEMAKDVRKFFPTVGDSPEVIAQKAQARKVAMRGMVVQAGPGASQIPGIVGTQSNGGSAVPPDIQAILDKHKGK